MKPQLITNQNNKMKNDLNAQIALLKRYGVRDYTIENDKITINGSLYLSSLTSIPEGFNPTVGGCLDLRSLTSIPEGFNPTVGGDLDLSSLTSIPEGFNPTVGGYLYLSSLTSIPEGFNPTVGGYLDLRSLTSIPEGFKNIEKWKAAKVKKTLENIITPKNKLLFWQDGKYVIADGLFTEVLSKKGNVYRVRKLHSPKEFYLITNGVTHAHGETVEKAKEDFRFKLISEKLKNNPIEKDTIITIQYYRIVTGACELGVRNWMQQNNITNEKIKASELLPILEKTNAYGFEKFKSLVTF